MAWLDLGDPEGGFITLGVTWFGVHFFFGPEADMALSTNPALSWDNDGNDADGDIDTETVYVHENGHVLFLGHSQNLNAVMAPIYDGTRRNLADDDKDGITYLYDNSVTGSLSGAITDASNGKSIKGATVVLDGTSLQDSTGGKNAAYSITGIPDPVTYTIIVSKDGYEPLTIDRFTVSGVHDGENFSLTPTGGGGGDPGGGGACPPKKAAKGKC